MRQKQNKLKRLSTVQVMTCTLEKLRAIRGITRENSTKAVLARIIDAEFKRLSIEFKDELSTTNKDDGGSIDA